MPEAMPVPFKVAVMQPYFLPYLGYFQLIAAVDCFVLFDDVQFIRRGWIERNRYLLDGEARWFGLSLEAGPQHQLIVEKRIAPSFDCRTLLNKLRHAYRDAPFFESVMAWLEDLLEPLPAHICTLNECVLRACCQKLGIQTRFERASTFELSEDLRGQHRVLEVARRLGATCYLNMAAGVSMYDSTLFAAAGMRLQALSAQLVEYSQGRKGGVWVPGLSILDALMFVPVETVSDWCRSGRVETVSTSGIGSQGAA